MEDNERKNLPEPVASGWVRNSGARIFYRLYGGAGPYLILLHGNGEDYRCFSNQIGPFSKGFRLVAVDSRGHGDSTMGRGALTMEKMAEDVLAVMDGLKMERASVLGFSDGGNIAVAMAIKAPHRFEKLVLAGANLYPEGLKASFLKAVTRQYKRLRLRGLLSGKRRKEAKIVGLMVNEPRFSPHGLIKIPCPALVMAGERDLILKEHTELIARSLPKGRLAIIAGSDHFVLNRPEEVNPLIWDFLKEGAD